MSTPPLPLIDIPNAIAAHGILSGGRVSSSALLEILAAGYKTIINLQLETEDGVVAERALAGALGIEYVGIPVAGPAGINKDNAVALHRALEAAEQPVIVHCAAGNRVGALMAIRAHILQNASREAALRVGLETGLTSLEPVVHRVLDAVGSPLSEPSSA